MSNMNGFYITQEQGNSHIGQNIGNVSFLYYSTGDQFFLRQDVADLFNIQGDTVFVEDISNFIPVI